VALFLPRITQEGFPLDCFFEEEEIATLRSLGGGYGSTVAFVDDQGLFIYAHFFRWANEYIGGSLEFDGWYDEEEWMEAEDEEGLDEDEEPYLDEDEEPHLTE
jgi:hypothetical protein